MIIRWLVAFAIAAAIWAVPTKAQELDCFYAELRRVIDGDTLAMRVQVWRGSDAVMVDTVIRVAGIDSPERGRTAKCTSEKVKGQRATAFVLEWVDGVDDFLVCSTRRFGAVIGFEREKWGRVLAHVIRGDGSILADDLIAAKHARVYEGKKSDWCR